MLGRVPGIVAAVVVVFVLLMVGWVVTAEHDRQVLEERCRRLVALTTTERELVLVLATKPACAAAVTDTVLAERVTAGEPRE